MLLGTPDPWNAVADGYDELIRPALSTFSEAALAMARPPADARILDVATGPGTLAILASPRVREIVAIDFSEEMLRCCRARTASLPNVSVRHGDGQRLTLDASFEAAFSMFGLIFFPDRAAGLAGLLRALVPGGVAVVSCWPPPERSSAMMRGIASVQAAFPDAPEPPRPADPLESGADLKREMQAAGFVDVVVEEAEHRFTATTEEMWRGVAEGFAPIVHARQSMAAEAWEAAEARALSWLAEHHDPGEELAYVAHLCRGRRPA